MNGSERENTNGLCTVCVCVCVCRCLSDYEPVARDAYNQHISNPEVGMSCDTTDTDGMGLVHLQRDYVFLDVCVEGDLIGRLVLELYRHLCPRTAHNFLCLCTGERGDCPPQNGGVGGQRDEDKGPRLSYVNSLIHRVVPGGWIQGGG